MSAGLRISILRTHMNLTSYGA